MSRARCELQEKGRLLQFLLHVLVPLSRQKLYDALVYNRGEGSIFSQGLSVSLKLKLKFSEHEGVHFKVWTPVIVG